MKQIILSIILLCVLLVGCNTNTTTADNSQSSFKTEGNKMPDTSTPPQENSDNLTSDTNSSTTEVTSGELYDFIKTICPNAYITDTDGSLGVDLSYCNSSADYATIPEYIYSICRILGSPSYNQNPQNISFTYLTNDVLSTITITKFQNISDFSSSLFSTAQGDDGNAVMAVKILYDKIFFNHDIENSQKISLGDIADEYGADGGDSAVSAKPEDELWFYSSFDYSAVHEQDNSTYAINYRTDTDDLYSYGYSVWENINNSLDNLSAYMTTHPDRFTSNEIVIICFDGNTDTRLFEIVNTRSENSWKVTTTNYLNDDFKEGVLDAYHKLSE